MSARRTDGTIDPSKIIPPKTDNQSEFLKPKTKFEFSPFNNIVLDFSTSCTKDVAVAKMLGWLRGPIRLDKDEINLRHITIDQMPFLPDLYYTLEDHLLMLREDALDQVEIAFRESNTSEQFKEEAIDTLNDCEDLIVKANAYMSGLDDELLKGASSELRIDQAKTESTGEIYITLKSLDEWAKKNYQKSIIDIEINSDWNNTSISKHAVAQSKNDAPAKTSKTKEENLYATFAFLIEAFSQTAPKYRKGEKINVSELAQSIEDMATKANNGAALYGQKAETIKSIIERAVKEKQQKLPKK